MKDWISRNIEGGPLFIFIVAVIGMYGLGSIFTHDMKMSEYRTKHNLVHIEGWVKPSDLQNIHLQESE
jgi:hypothetical protein